MNLRWIKQGRDWGLYTPDAKIGLDAVGYMQAPARGWPWRFYGFMQPGESCYAVEVQAGSSLAARRLAEREIDRRSIGLLNADVVTFELTK